MEDRLFGMGFRVQRLVKLGIEKSLSTTDLKATPFLSFPESRDHPTVLFQGIGDRLGLIQ
jgi:hypothetical protein